MARKMKQRFLLYTALLTSYLLTYVVIYGKQEIDKEFMTKQQNAISPVLSPRKDNDIVSRTDDCRNQLIARVKRNDVNQTEALEHALRNSEHPIVYHKSLEDKIPQLEDLLREVYRMMFAGSNKIDFSVSNLSIPLIPIGLRGVYLQRMSYKAKPSVRFKTPEKTKNRQIKKRVTSSEEKKQGKMFMSPVMDRDPTEKPTIADNPQPQTETSITTRPETPPATLFSAQNQSKNEGTKSKQTIRSAAEQLGPFRILMKLTQDVDEVNNKSSHGELFDLNDHKKDSKMSSKNGDDATDDSAGKTETNFEHGLAEDFVDSVAEDESSYSKKQTILRRSNVELDESNDSPFKVNSKSKAMHKEKAEESIIPRSLVSKGKDPKWVKKEIVHHNKEEVSKVTKTKKESVPKNNDDLSAARVGMMEQLAKKFHLKNPLNQNTTGKETKNEVLSKTTIKSNLTRHTFPKAAIYKIAEKGGKPSVKKTSNKFSDSKQQVPANKEHKISEKKNSRKTKTDGQNQQIFFEQTTDVHEKIQKFKPVSHPKKTIQYLDPLQQNNEDRAEAMKIFPQYNDVFSTSPINFFQMKKTRKQNKPENANTATDKSVLIANRFPHYDDIFSNLGDRENFFPMEEEQNEDPLKNKHFPIQVDDTEEPIVLNSNNIKEFPVDVTSAENSFHEYLPEPNNEDEIAKNDTRKNLKDIFEMISKEHGYDKKNPNFSDLRNNWERTLRLSGVIHNQEMPNYLKPDYDRLKNFYVIGHQNSLYLNANLENILQRSNSSEAPDSFEEDNGVRNAQLFGPTLQQRM